MPLRPYRRDRSRRSARLATSAAGLDVTLMALVASVLAALIVAISILGLVSPASMDSLISRFGSGTGYAATIVLRLVLGVVFWRVAPVSRTPAFLHVMGALWVGSALVMLGVGLQRFQRVLAWAGGQPASVKRIWSALGLVLGAVMLWSVA